MQHPEKPVLRLVAYYRAASADGEVSAANLDKQRAAVDAYGWFERSEIVAEFVELEGFETETRPQLTLAISIACRMNANILIAGIGFLVESTHFLSTLYEAEKTSGVRTFACGYSNGNPLPIKFLLDAAKFTTRSRAELARAGLKAAKARGVKLGATGPDHARIATLAKVAKASKLRSQHLTVIRGIQRANPSMTTFQAIADALNVRGVGAPRGGLWSPTQVRRVMVPEVKVGRAKEKDAAETSNPPAEPDRARNRVLH